MQNHSKGQYPTEKGVDPRGWAWILYQYSPPYYSFNDYLYASQEIGDYDLAWALHSTGKPAGVIVWHGYHAMLAVGYRSTDPLEFGGTVQGFYLWDPWYQAHDRDDTPPYDYYYGSTWLYGIAPNVYYTLAKFNGTDDDNRTMFSRNWASATPGVDYWKGSYVLVLRTNATNGEAPKDHPPLPYGEPDGMMTPIGSPPPDAVSVDAALAVGLRDNGLVDENAFGLDLSGVTVGRTIDVMPAADGITPYVLAEVVSHGQVVAIAQLDATALGFRFAAIAPVVNDGRLPTIASVRARAGALGASGESVTAVWGPSDDSPSPFYPMWQVSTGSTRSYLTPAGSVLDALPLYPAYEALN